MARRNAVWSSCNASMDRPRGTLHAPLSPVGFALQHSQCWDIRVPLDQGGHWAKAAQGVSVEGPDRVGDRRTMIVDQYRLAIGVIYGVPREVDLTHRVSW